MNCVPLQDFLLAAHWKCPQITNGQSLLFPREVSVLSGGCRRVPFTVVTEEQELVQLTKLLRVRRGVPATSKVTALLRLLLMYVKSLMSIDFSSTVGVFSTLPD